MGSFDDGFAALYYMNVWRILADITHALSKCILIFAIHRNRSAEGVSLISQGLYVLVFLSRYLDLFYTNPTRNTWNLIFKIFYITSSFYILLLMTRVFARTREREKAWRMGAYTLVGSLALAPFVAMIAKHTWAPPFTVILVDFSLILESVCVLPQLLLLRQTAVPTVIDSYYLVALGAYRALYICNWIERFAVKDRVAPEGVAVVFGVLQTLLYCDFAWVYYSRQRVKLRGGVVDAEDLGKSWVLRRVFGRRTRDEEEADEEESRPALGGEGDEEGPAAGRARQGWGRRGMSVSADEDVLAMEAGEGSPIEPDAKMRDPDELAKILDEEDESEEEARAPRPVGVSGGEEWRDRSGSR